MKTKVCPKCKKEKSIGEFGKEKKSKDGYKCYCKKCWNNYNKKYIKDWYRNNKDRIVEYKKVYNEENKENISRKGKIYYEERSGYIKQRVNIYRHTIALYSTYHSQLTVDEEPRLAEDGISLEVRCKYCGRYFKPINREIVSRINSLSDRTRGYGHLYCSEGCKYSCSIFNQKLYPKDHKPATSREVQPQLRKLVLERDNYTCQKCGSVDELHCHHIDPVANNPIESADVDNCITYCVECHKEAHSQIGCGYNEISKC